MATSFPTSADSFTNPTGSDSLSTSVGGRTHSAMHADLNDATEAVQAFILSGSPLAPSVKTADYTLVLGDAGKTIEVNSATAKVVTVPPESSVDWTPGTVIGLYQAGAGNVTVAQGAGVTVRNNAALRGQYAEASLRYRGSDEWVLAGDLASASAPALKDYAEVNRTAGNVTLNATAVTAVATALDLTIAADTGDLVEFGISAMLQDVAQAVCFEVYTMPSGSPVNPFGAGIASGLGDNKQGIAAWEITAAMTSNVNLSGGMTRVLLSGDVSGGSTTLRLYYAKLTTTARTLYANADIPLKVWAKNYGQV